MRKFGTKFGGREGRVKSPMLTVSSVGLGSVVV